MALQVHRPRPGQRRARAYLSFQESTDQLVAKAIARGWDLAGPLRTGQLRILCLPRRM